jgi:hypothetical protein
VHVRTRPTEGLKQRDKSPKIWACIPVASCESPYASRILRLSSNSPGNKQNSSKNVHSLALHPVALQHWMPYSHQRLICIPWHTQNCRLQPQHVYQTFYTGRPPCLQRPLWQSQHIPTSHSQLRARLQSGAGCAPQWKKETKVLNTPTTLYQVL